MNTDRKLKILHFTPTWQALVIMGFLTIGLFACSPNSSDNQTIDITGLIEANQLDEAVTQVNASLAEHPANADLLYNLATIYKLQKKWDAAKTAADKALSIAPADDEIITLLAELALDNGQTQEAWDKISKVSEKGKKSPAVQSIEGSVFSQMGNWQQAEIAFRTALELGSPESMAKASLAFVMIRQNRMDEGKKLLQEADNSRQKSENASRQIAECYLALGNGQEAKRIAYSLNPDKQNDARLWSVIGRADVMLLSFGEAESTFTRALACPNTTPSNLIEYANMLFAAQREDEALQKALEAEEQLKSHNENAHNPLLYNLLATIYAKKGQVNLAQQYLEQSLLIDSNQIKVKELIDRITQSTLTTIPAGEVLPASDVTPASDVAPVSDTASANTVNESTEPEQ